MNAYAWEGEAWIVETLSNAKDLRGWAAKRIELDAHTRGYVHVELTDRYGRVFKYLIAIWEERPS